MITQLMVQPSSLIDDLIIKKPKWQEWESIIGLWKDDPEIDEIFDIINQERHQDLGREVNLD